MTLPGSIHYLKHGLGATPIVVESLLAGLTDAEVDFRPDADRFTLRESLAHLADWEPIWKERLDRIRTEENPTLPGYDEGQFAIDNDYAHSDAAEQLARFLAGRAALLAVIEAADAETWQRTGIHAERGPITFYDLAVIILGHDGYHLRQFVEWRDAYKNSGK